MLWRMHGMAALIGLLPAFAATNTGIIQVTGIRSWSHPDSTRVILQTTGPAEYKYDSAHNPERLFIDIEKSRPSFDGKRFATHPVNDSVVKRVRVAETTPGTTRIVFDLVAPSELKVSRLEDPDRLVIELRPVVSHLSALRPAPATLAAPIVITPIVVTSSVIRGRHFINPPLPLHRSIFVPPAPALTASLDWALPFPLPMPGLRPPKPVHLAALPIAPAGLDAGASSFAARERRRGAAHVGKCEPLPHPRTRTQSEPRGDRCRTRRP